MGCDVMFPCYAEVVLYIYVGSVVCDGLMRKSGRPSGRAPRERTFGLNKASDRFGTLYIILHGEHQTVYVVHYA